tara:strand:- start:4087 stop:4356 length:270 start_codon:yes stop_codon:yes gene_type:complete
MLLRAIFDEFERLQKSIPDDTTKSKNTNKTGVYPNLSPILFRFGHSCGKFIHLASHRIENWRSHAVFVFAQRGRVDGRFLEALFFVQNL